jgi:hypothetical protein
MSAVATPVPNNDVVSVVASPMARDMIPVKVDGERESVFQRRSMEEMMEPLTAVYVSQRLAPMEAVTCGCCAYRNSYQFHAGIDENAPLFLVGNEKSPCLSRCCCNPIHSQFIELSDTSSNVLYTVERQGCCLAKPGLCCMFPCTDSCTQEITLHEGKLEGEPGAVTNPHPLYTVTQKRSCEGGACTPELKLIPQAVGDKGAEEMNSKLVQQQASLAFLSPFFLFMNYPNLHTSISSHQQLSAPPALGAAPSCALLVSSMR